MKNIHFFPEKVKQLIKDKVVDVDFNIEQMIPEFLVNEFGMENIINAIDELEITYNELTSIGTCSSHYTAPFVNRFHDICRTEKKEKRDRYGNLESSYLVYTYYEFSLVQKGQELLTKLVTDKFPYLNEFKTKKIVSFRPYKFINEHNRLSDIPKEFRDYTVNELISMVGVQEREIDATLCKMYTSGLTDFDKWEFYLNCPEVINSFGDVDSLYVPYRALKENDYSIIHKRTESYLKSYHNPCDAAKLKVLTCKTALKLKKLMKLTKKIETDE